MKLTNKEENILVETITNYIDSVTYNCTMYELEDSQSALTSAFRCKLISSNTFNKLYDLYPSIMEWVKKNYRDLKESYEFKYSVPISVVYIVINCIKDGTIKK